MNEETEEDVICPNCGAELSSNQEIFMCESCGTEVCQYCQGEFQHNCV